MGRRIEKRTEKASKVKTKMNKSKHKLRRSKTIAVIFVKVLVNSGEFLSLSSGNASDFSNNLLQFN